MRGQLFTIKGLLSEFIAKPIVESYPNHYYHARGGITAVQFGENVYAVENVSVNPDDSRMSSHIILPDGNLHRLEEDNERGLIRVSVWSVAEDRKSQPFSTELENLSSGYYLLFQKTKQERVPMQALRGPLGLGAGPSWIDQILLWELHSDNILPSENARLEDQQSLLKYFYSLVVNTYTS